MRVVSLGEILWDVIGGTEFLGGAPFNICAHAVQLGHDAIFVSAVGADDRGKRARARAAELGIDSRYLQQTSKAPTGISQVVLDSEGRAEHHIPRPAAYDFVELSEAQAVELANSGAEWICYGTLTNMQEQPRSVLSTLLQATPSARRFYDVNLRPGLWTPPLVKQLMQSATAAKLNDDEVTVLNDAFGWHAMEPRAFAESAAREFGLEFVCITRGPDGCLLWQKGQCVTSPGFRITVSDTVGAGDAFSAALLHGMNQNWELSDVAEFANRVGALVASRAGATPVWTEAEARQLTRG